MLKVYGTDANKKVKLKIIVKINIRSHIINGWFKFRGYDELVTLLSVNIKKKYTNNQKMQKWQYLFVGTLLCVHMYTKMSSQHFFKLFTI